MMIQGLNGVRFNPDLYLAVRRVREERGIPVMEAYMFPNSGEIVAHPMKGKRFFDKKSGKIYRIETVHRHWYMGWYEMAVVECNGSHGTRMIANLGCHNDIIVEGIMEFWRDAEFIVDR